MLSSAGYFSLFPTIPSMIYSLRALQAV
jgi:hypothetical protein